MYPSEFIEQEAPLLSEEAGLLLGVEPLLLGVFVILLIVAGLVGYLIGRRAAARRSPDKKVKDAPDAIHAAVLKASAAARSAHSDELRARARTLQDVLRHRLPGLIAIIAGIGGPLSELERALEGRRSAEHPDAHDPHGADVDRPRTEAPAPQPPVSVNIFSGAAPHKAAHPEQGHKPHWPGGHDDRLSSEEETQAIDRAVRRFHDAWSKLRSELNTLRDGLSTPPPHNDHHHKSGHVGGRHDDPHH